MAPSEAHTRECVYPRTRDCGQDTPTACALRPRAHAEDRCHQQRSVQFSRKHQCKRKVKKPTLLSQGSAVSEPGFLNTPTHIRPGTHTFVRWESWVQRNNGCTADKWELEHVISLNSTLKYFSLKNAFWGAPEKPDLRKRKHFLLFCFPFIFFFPLLIFFIVRIERESPLSKGR